jgi:5-methylcytosine-specific restriction endonuclease McrA
LICCGKYSEQTSIDNWLAGKVCGHTGKTKKVKPFVRAYLFKKYNGSCSKCKWNTPHPSTGMPVLESNHIDGNAENTIESNLELLCLNCHGLTLNFKNRNKGNGKRNR